MGTAEQFLLLQHLTLLAPLGKGGTQVTPSKRQKRCELGQAPSQGLNPALSVSPVLILQGSHQLGSLPTSWRLRIGLLPLE